ncbi:Polysaccharide deacetylase [Micromonospora purpureochromogenes]|uniref:Polysaccharide deacetylase n=1 Tax=Micromonospora purpureochromogenes TaxID=47872 RepID=A0A1C4VNZ5_9ACTN|nr:polysaccharide deacetylase family protein [Micromonospora purpureochromogenes]SCE85696.1 Polysaccharide deacetylase [Micromonospora purpureochromogenes]
MTTPLPAAQGGPRRPALRRHLAELGAALLALAAMLAFTSYVRHPPAAEAGPADEAGPAVPRPASTANPCLRGRVMLTFDDGPDAHTRGVLEVLRAYDARATFFVLGVKVRAHPELVAAEVADGHQVENHSWDHPHLADLSAAEVRTQLADTQAAVVAAGAPAPTLVRPPFGNSGPVVHAQAEALRLREVRWSIDTNDWRGRAPADIRDAVLAGVRPGSVILLHDGSRESGNTVRALPGIIEGLRERGFCTASMRS